MWSPMSRYGSARDRKSRGKVLRWAAIFPRCPLGREARLQFAVFLQSAQRPERCNRRRRRAPARHDPPNGGVIDGFDAPYNVGWVERGAVDQQMLGELLAASRGALERHQEPCLHLRLGPAELYRRQPILQLHRLFAQRRHQLGRLVLAGPGVDPEQSAVAITMDKGVDRIDETAFLANFLE